METTAFRVSVADTALPSQCSSRRLLPEVQKLGVFLAGASEDDGKPPPHCRRLATRLRRGLGLLVIQLRAGPITASLEPASVFVAVETRKNLSHSTVVARYFEAGFLFHADNLGVCRRWLGRSGNSWVSSPCCHLGSSCLIASFGLKFRDL